MSFDAVSYHQGAVATRRLAEVGLAGGVRALLAHGSMPVPESPDQCALQGYGYAKVLADDEPAGTRSGRPLGI